MLGGSSGWSLIMIWDVPPYGVLLPFPLSLSFFFFFFFFALLLQTEVHTPLAHDTKNPKQVPTCAPLARCTSCGWDG